MRKTMKNVGVRNDFPAHEHVSKGPKQQQQQQQEQHERILVSYNPIQRTAKEKEEKKKEDEEERDGRRQRLEQQVDLEIHIKTRDTHLSDDSNDHVNHVLPK
uniref:Uncharacterized protein n=1 Tax=Vespula pensylvanica TaxID=30213 RepID=A0A834K8Q5_VESPE|nr:hypothetical protein H0235_015522 [Vespula pensylvanica]